MAKLVSRTYGDALFETALESRMLDDYVEEAAAVKAALEENPQLAQLMTHPGITKEEKRELIEEIFAGMAKPQLVGLMCMMAEKGHFAQMADVLDYFLGKAKETKGIGTAYVTSAMALSMVQKAAVEKRLVETTKYVKFEMHYDVDAALIGGMVIRIGDRVVDSSVRTKLEHLTRELSKIQLKAGEGAT